MRLNRSTLNVYYQYYYTLEVCPLNKADIQSLDFCVNRLLVKLFCTNNLSLSELLCMRAEKFWLKLNANCG